MKDKIINVFKEKFRQEPVVITSPGRINIIGEHTDYNEGFVLPAAIDKAIYVGITKRSDSEIHLYSCEFDELFITNLAHLKPEAGKWYNYVLGIVDQIQAANHSIGGFNLVLDGNVPLGAGLSSSAAVECAAIFALNELFELSLDKFQMVKMAQMAEHTFAGVKCGIMDMFASMFGKENHAIRLDCRDLSYQYTNLDLKGYSLVLLNSNVKHNLASTAYNERRAQCEQGVSWIREKHPEVVSLRDVTMDMLTEIVYHKDQLVYTRCKYVVEESQRLLSACKALDAGDFEVLGSLMYATHYGLQNEYEVSCKEIDFLVEKVQHNPVFVGSRMMGGGFGGCTINLIRGDIDEVMIQEIANEYTANFGLELTIIPIQIGAGTRLL
ncbi:MAG: galactokinase [Leadbetterella sp.]